MTTSPGSPLLRIAGVTKSYGAVRAIRNADMELKPGTVHALVGENGAGKSTLIKIISGAVGADSGTIEFGGRSVEIASTGAAMALGIATAYQEPQLFDELSAAENIFLGRELRKGPRIDWNAQNVRVLELLDMIGLPAQCATRPAGELGIAQRQQLSIAKALAGNARVLILDEPSAILTDKEIRVLFAIVRRLTDSGVAVIYISHRLDELFRIADEVTIMRDGETVGTYPLQGLTIREIAKKMVGGALSDDPVDRATPDGPVVLELNGLDLPGAFGDVDLQVRAGETLCLYGLIGSGAESIAEAVYGVVRPASGRILLQGKEIRPRSPKTAKRLGIGLLPSDRKGQGLFSFQSIKFNVSVGQLGLLSRIGVVDRRRERDAARSLVKRLRIKAPNEMTSVSALSGGNAQKVVLARQVVERPRVLVLSEPTQGVDIGAKEEIHRIIQEVAGDGTAVLLVTSDLPEALRMSDRLLVVREGHIVAEFGPAASQVDVLAAAAGEEVLAS
jgi:ABC-type sugar transport system ATPase subunit